MRVPRIVHRIVDPILLGHQVVDGETQVGVGAVHGGDHVLGALAAGRLAGQRIVIEEVGRHQVAHRGPIAGRDHVLEDVADERLVGLGDHGRTASATGANMAAWSRANAPKLRGGRPVSDSTVPVTSPLTPCRA